MSTRPQGELEAAIRVGDDATVLDAIRAMIEGEAQAAVIVKNDRVLGVLTQRDVLARVVLELRDPAVTPVRDVMTRTVTTVREGTDRATAMRTMIEEHIRHLPVVDREQRVVAMMSLARLLGEDNEDLRTTVWAMVADLSPDSRGG